MKYALMLNDMHSSNVENIQCVMASDDPEKLVEFYFAHLADAFYRDGQWGKAFKKDSPLEWFNPVHNATGGIPKNDYWGGIHEFPNEVPFAALSDYSLAKASRR